MVPIESLSVRWGDVDMARILRGRPAGRKRVIPGRYVGCVMGSEDRRIIVFDVETTGTDKRRDQVIELCVQLGLEGGPSQTWRIKPDVSIHPGAQAVHGISAEDLEFCPRFGQVAAAI